MFPVRRVKTIGPVYGFLLRGLIGLPGPSHRRVENQEREMRKEVGVGTVPGICLRGGECPGSAAWFGGLTWHEAALVLVRGDTKVALAAGETIWRNLAKGEGRVRGHYAPTCSVHKEQMNASLEGLILY